MKAAGKLKKAERQHDEELGEKMTDHLAKNAKPKGDPEPKSDVGGEALRGVVSETMARVYSELWPGMQTHTDRHGAVDVEIAEEAYILVNGMVCGTPHELPRQPVRIKDADISATAGYCEAHG